MLVAVLQLKLYRATDFVYTESSLWPTAAEKHLFFAETVWDTTAVEMFHWYTYRL